MYYRFLLFWSYTVNRLEHYSWSTKLKMLYKKNSAKADFFWDLHSQMQGLLNKLHFPNKKRQLYVGAFGIGKRFSPHQPQIGAGRTSNEDASGLGQVSIPPLGVERWPISNFENWKVAKSSDIPLPKLIPR